MRKVLEDAGVELDHELLESVSGGYRPTGCGEFVPCTLNCVCD